MTIRVIFLDLNSYFASVEQAEHPELMGRPVAVVPSLVDTTCCLAASYPAKACGVRTGTLVKDARKLCPNIQFIEANHEKYVSYHHRIIEAVERCLPVTKVCSIDEMSFELVGREQTLDFALSKARSMKERIRVDVHPALTCSIGIAPNRYIAKMASDMQKPDGLTVIQSHELPSRLFGLKLRDFPGIGPRMEERLVAARCNSAASLCQRSFEELTKLWGTKVGGDFWKLIHGEQIPERDSPRASFSHSRVLAPVDRTPEKAWPHLVALVTKAAMRLRYDRFYAKSMQLSIKLLSNERQSHSSTLHSNTWHRGCRFFETQDTNMLLAELSKLWKEAPRSRLLRVGITLGGLVVAEKHQLSIFENAKQANLMAAIDNLNKKIRKNLVVLGSSADLKEGRHAPIAFGHIPNEFE